MVLKRLCSYYVLSNVYCVLHFELGINIILLHFLFSPSLPLSSSLLLSSSPSPSTLSLPLHSPLSPQDTVFENPVWRLSEEEQEVR